MNDRKQLINFHCGACGWNFEGAPGRIEEAPEQEWHPWRYFAGCPMCDSEARQAGWERSLFKAWRAATGPKTEQGKASTALNLAGNNTPEQIARSRFNAMKHGAFAKTATYYPSKPGKYPHCSGCEHFNRGCDEFPVPPKKNPAGCLKRVELFMDFHIAFDTRDPGLLTKYSATMQALAWQITNDMILQVIQDGTALKTPEWHYDKEGNLHYPSMTGPDGQAAHIMRVEAHPLLKLIIDFMNRNGMALPDSGMTMKVKDENEQVRGFLDSSKADAESAQQFRERQTKSLEHMAALIERSQRRQKLDPVLIEHAAVESEEAQP